MKKALAFLICFAMIVSNLSVFTGAFDVSIDLGDLFDEEPETDNDENGGETVTPPADDDDEGETVTPPADDDDEGETIVPPVEDDDDDDTATDDEKDNNSNKNNNNKGNTTNKNKDDKKEEEPKVYNTKFTDVTEDKWFYSYVTDLASKGIINGYDDDNDGVFEFRPQNNITRAEFLKLLVECMGYSQSALPVFTDVTEDKWYYTVVSTAAKNGIISVEEYGENLRPNEVITRSEVAKLIVRATKTETGKYKTPYVDVDDEYITALYAICLMQGSKDDATGDRYFKADSNITRAETSTVFSRLLEYNADPEGFVKAKTEEYQMPALELVETVNYVKTIKDIGENPMSFFNFILADTSSVSHNDYSENLLAEFSRQSSVFPELFTFTSLKVTKAPVYGGVQIGFGLKSMSEEFTLEELYSLKIQAEEKAKSVIDEIFGEEKLSETQKVVKIYKYLFDNVEYPENDQKDVYYTAYGALVDGRAFCQGYSSAFNLLCKYADVKSVSVEKDDHIWNGVKTQEGVFYCDASFEDSAGEKFDVFSKKENNLCMVTKEQMEKLHGKFNSPLEIYFTLE